MAQAEKQSGVSHRTEKTNPADVKQGIGTFRKRMAEDSPSTEARVPVPDPCKELTLLGA